MSDTIRCVRIGANTINLHNFQYMRITKAKGTNSNGQEFTDVYLLTLTFPQKPHLELQFDTRAACEGARDFIEAHAGSTVIMPDEILNRQDEKEE